ncbi:sensor histidine kinase [Streptomyces sp. NPDC054796]
MALQETRAFDEERDITTPARGEAAPSGGADPSGGTGVAATTGVTATASATTVSRAPSGSGLPARFAREAAAGLGRDLLLGAFSPRPLPPLAGLPVPSRVRRALPGALVRALRWIPHAAVVALTLLLVALQAQAEVPVRDKVAGGLLIAVPLLLTLRWPVLASWLLLAAAGVSLFHPWGLEGPFPFADLGAWPDVAGGTAGRPWAMAGLLACTAAMLLAAFRLPPRAVGWLWALTVVVAAAGNGPFAFGTLATALFAALMPLTSVIATGRRTARAEAAAHAAASEEERARRTVLEERAVIARELHDVVAHHMSVIAIQAEAAPHRVKEPPPELEAAFATVRESALIALTELRRVLGVIRTAPSAGPDAAPEAPQPTLGDLDGLLAGVRAAGRRVETSVGGRARSLPRGVELSAYRIVQEALSNALRHAPEAPIRLELAYSDGGLDLRVVNAPPTRPAPASPGAGHGLTGMRERVTMLGGWLDAGGTEEGGFAVTAFLPSPRTGDGASGARDSPGTRDRHGVRDERRVAGDG